MVATGWRRVDPIARPLQEKVDAAALGAIDDTTAAAAIYAKQNHPGWQNRTSTAEGSIRLEPAKKISATRYRGLFGSFDVAYFIFLELGHFVASAGGFRHDPAQNHGESAFARFVGGDHTLRRAADAEFPKISERLRRRMR